MTNYDMTEEQQAIQPDASVQTAKEPSVFKLWLTALKVGAILLGYIVVNFAVSFFYQFVLKDWLMTFIPKDIYSDLSNLILNFLMFVVGFTLLFILARIKTDLPIFGRCALPKKQVAKIIVIGLGATYAVSYISSFIFSIIESLAGVELNSISDGMNPTLLGVIAFALPVMLFAPVFEELLFRGGILSNMARFGGWMSCIMTGLFFGLAHMNYPQIFATAALGTMSAFLLYKTKTIVPSIILHLSLNSIATVATLLTTFFDVDNLSIATSLDVGASIAMLVISALGIGVLSLIVLSIVFFVKEMRHNRDFWRLPGPSSVSLTNKMFALLTSPTLILFFIFAIALSIANALLG